MLYLWEKICRELLSPEEVLDQDNRWLNDGCGGTRMKYGNRTLLSATNGVLFALEKALGDSEPFAIKSSINTGITECTISKIWDVIFVIHSNRLIKYLLPDGNELIIHAQVINTLLSHTQKFSDPEVVAFY